MHDHSLAENVLLHGREMRLFIEELSNKTMAVEFLI
jgi:hypothetical protein